MDEFVGVVKMFGGNFAPVNWVFCDGRALQISQYEVLYTLIGTTFGGDGVTTFNVPNLNGNIPVGAGRSTAGTVYAPGQKGGSNAFTMTLQNLPAHAHAIIPNQGVGMIGEKANGTASSTADPSNCIPGVTTADAYANSGSEPMGATVSTLVMTNAGSASPAPLDNRSPFIAMNYIISTVGIWPSPAN